MWAALRLRLRQARRRRGLPLLAVSVLVIGCVARFAADTPEGRYGLATDLAAVLTYAAAILYGAFPIAIDRERRRACLSAASPVPPWSWALGNALGAAVIALGTGVVLFTAAAAGGGIPTHAVTRMEVSGAVGLPLRIRVPAGATRLRILPIVYVQAEETVGIPDAAILKIDGREYAAYPSRPIEAPLDGGGSVHIENLSKKTHVVRLAADEVRAIGRERPFLANAAAVGVAPSLGAAALAAFAAAAGANLGAPVAALLAASILLLAAMKGFLLETMEHEGSAARVMHHGGQLHGEAEEDPTAAAARAVIRGVLLVLPDAAALDRTDRVALGDWTGLAGARRGVEILAAALLLAAVVGGAGVHGRRLP